MVYIIRSNSKRKREKSDTGTCLYRVEERKILVEIYNFARREVSRQRARNFEARLNWFFVAQRRD